jgi:hypothetical protein
MSFTNSIIFRRSFTAFALSCVLSTFASAQIARDWNRYPAVAEAQRHKELYALGDVHGDYDRMVELLAGAHLITPNPATPDAVQWTGSSDVLVCTGDMIDKYDHAMNVIALLCALQPLAFHDGGRVIVTLGNHEAEFLARGSAGKKATDFGDELQAAGISPASVATGQDSAGIGRWLGNLPVAAMVGDWFFCHAGNTGGLTVAQLDQRVAAEVNAGGFGAPILADANSLLEARMHPRPWWDWDGQPPALKDATASNSPAPTSQPTSEARLRTMIRALGAEHLVFGHQPGEIKFDDGADRPAGEVFQKFNGLVFLIDTGMSRGVSGGRGALLHISNGSVHGASAVYADGTISVLVP